jgi:endoglucanase
MDSFFFKLPAITSFLFLTLFFQLDHTTGQVKLTGVNLAGAEFGENNLPGIYNQHYTYPTRAEVDYFISKGMNTFRLPFRWERLQHEAFGSLDGPEIGRIKNFINYTSSKGAFTILDPHNYARYYGNLIGSANLPADAFADFWKKVATEFKHDSLVIFGLMNEPHSMSTEQWLAGANSAIAAIRSAGAPNLVLVPGNGWSGAHSWTSNWYGTPNSTVMKGVVDSLDNYAYDVHQYFDNNSSGTSSTCVSATVGADRLKTFTTWLRVNNKKGFLGEFGIANNEMCLDALDNMLAYIHDNRDVWYGWTYWAAGPWWGDYMFSVEPQGGNDKPQMAVLEKYAGDLSTSAFMHPVQQELVQLFFPNPVTSSSNISFFIPETSRVELYVLNNAGNRIACLVNDKRDAGNYNISWNADKRMIPGIYFLYLKTASTYAPVVKKMVVQ